MSLRYLVAASKSWNEELLLERAATLPGSWSLVTEKSDLTPEYVKHLGPRYIFFPHWSYIVPSEIWESTECVCFHMTDVPYGRGGSPLQNLIIRGHISTKLTALRMEREVDAGPVYLKRNLNLEGTASEILRRAAILTWEMIDIIVRTEPSPVPQTGQVFSFKRRTQEEGDLKEVRSLQGIYDHIRMLDGEGYPPAFLRTDFATFEFRNARLNDGELEASVRITPRSPGGSSAG